MELPVTTSGQCGLDCPDVSLLQLELAVAASYYAIDAVKALVEVFACSKIAFVSLPAALFLIGSLKLSCLKAYHAGPVLALQQEQRRWKPPSGLHIDAD